MTLNFAVGFVIAAMLLLIIWALKGVLLTPVRTGDNTEIVIGLNLHGHEPALEQTLRGLLWLRENGTLKANIRIMAHGSDEETRHIARHYEAEYRCIYYTEEDQDNG